MTRQSRSPILTLWDLLKTAVSPAPASPAAARPRARRTRSRTPTAPPSASSMEARYERITRDMLQQHGIRVRRWRMAMTGIAWQVRYRDGSIARLIEAPRPRGPMSAAVFLHEIGHHVIGFDTYKPRCLEEFHAWAYAISQMESLGLNVTEAVRRRMHLSLRYAVQKARRRGLRELPVELEPFVGPWPGQTPARRRRPPPARARPRSGARTR